MFIIDSSIIDVGAGPRPDLDQLLVAYEKRFEELEDVSPNATTDEGRQKLILCMRLYILQETLRIKKPARGEVRNELWKRHQNDCMPHVFEEIFEKSWEKIQDYVNQGVG